MNGLRKFFLIFLLNFACFYDNPMLLVVTSLSILFLLTYSRHIFHLFISYLLINTNLLLYSFIIIVI